MAINSNQPPAVDKAIREAGRQITIFNASGMTIPASSFVEIISSANGVHSVVRPRANGISPSKLAVTGATAIPATAATAQATPAQAGKLWVAYSDSAPLKDETFGSVEDSFEGARNQNGFRVHSSNAGLTAVTPISGGYGFDSTVFGFVDRAESELTWDDVTRTLTITATGTTKNVLEESTFDYVFAGERRTKITSDSIELPLTDGTRYVFYNSDNELESSDTVWVFGEVTQVCRIFLSTALADAVPLDERHNHTMSTATHEMEHDIEGMKWKSGGVLNGYTLGLASDAGISFGTSLAVVRDEDFPHTIAAVTDPGTITVFYRFGTDLWRWDTEAGFGFLYDSDGTGRVDYNELAGNWGRAEPPDNRYVVYWIGFSNAIETEFKVWSLMGQDVYTTLAEAQEASSATLNLEDFPFKEEGLFAWRIIVQTKNSFGGTMSAKIREVVDVRAARDLPAGATLIPSHNAIPDRNVASAHLASAVHEAGFGHILFGATAPNGWLLCRGGSIGNAASGAATRANADTLALFVHLWDNFANAQLAVSGGRGADAETDFAADKTIALPDLRQRFPLGLGVTDHGTLGSTDGNAENARHPVDHGHGFTGAATDDPGDHSHGPGTLATDSDLHTHGVDAATNRATTGITIVDWTPSLPLAGDPTGSEGYVNQAGLVHTHAIVEPSSGTGHLHVIDVTTDGDEHSHDVDSGVTGVDGAHTHTSAGSVGSKANFPDFFVVNYIISLGVPA